MTDEIRTPTLSLSIQWWTPENMAPEIGKSAPTIYRRAGELRGRGIITGKRCIWSREEALKVAEYVLLAGRKNKSDSGVIKSTPPP